MCSSIGRIAVALLSATIATAAVAGGVPPAKKNTLSGTIATTASEANDGFTGVEIANEVAEAGLKSSSRTIIKGASEQVAQKALGMADAGVATQKSAKNVARTARRVGTWDANKVDRKLTRDFAAAGKTLDMAGNVADVVEVGAHAINGDWAEVAQFATEKAIDEVGETLSGAACAPFGPAAIEGCENVWDKAHNVAGAAARNFDTCRLRDCGPGEKYTVQDGVTDAYFAAYEKVKFTIYPELDPRSDEFEAAARAKSDEMRRKYQESATSLQNKQMEADEAEREQQRQLDAQAEREAQRSDGEFDFMNSLILNAMVQQALTPHESAPAPVLRPAAPPRALQPNEFDCDIRTPNGGCRKEAVPSYPYP
jgi:hypothetical protein